MNIENFAPVATAIGGGFFVGLLIGFSLKKVVKILAIVVGLFFAGLAYLQYQQIVNIDWNKLQPVSHAAINGSKCDKVQFLDLPMLVAIQQISLCLPSGFR